MSSGGIIIMRKAIQQALTDPLVHGQLPDKMKVTIDPVLAKDVNDWTTADHHAAVHVFDWAAVHVV